MELQEICKEIALKKTFNAAVEYAEHLLQNDFIEHTPSAETKKFSAHIDDPDDKVKSVLGEALMTIIDEFSAISGQPADSQLIDMSLEHYIHPTSKVLAIRQDIRDSMNNKILASTYTFMDTAAKKSFELDINTFKLNDIHLDDMSEDEANKYEMAFGLG